MGNTWKPTTAGVLNIISGIISLIVVFGLIIAILFLASTGNSPFFEGMFTDFEAGGVALSFVITVLVILTVIYAITGILPLIAGIFALQRKKWGLALAGSIIAIFGTFLLGLLATIFTALSKDEFS